MLAFHKATKEARKNETVEVVRVEQGNKLIARKETGQEITLTRRQAQAFSVHERTDIQIAPGDKLLLEANRHETGFRATNGELVTVAGVEHGRIQLKDGRTLPANYRAFDHGYVVTAHRSQGKTVDAVIVAGDRMPQELFYVAATRGRESLTVITSDKEQLREAIGISGERRSASELARQAEEQKTQAHRLPAFSLGHGIQSAGHWSLWQKAALAEAEQQRHGLKQGFEQGIARETERGERTNAGEQNRPWLRLRFLTERGRLHRGDAPRRCWCSCDSGAMCCRGVCFYLQREPTRK